MVTTLPVVPPNNLYHGGPIPKGLMVDIRRQKGLIIGGFISMGAAYNIGIVAAVSANANGPSSSTSALSNLDCSSKANLSLIPLVGFWAAAVSLSSSGCLASQTGLYYRTAGAINTALQLGGLFMAISGMAHRNLFLVVDPDAAENTESGVKVSVVPEGNGLSLIARF